MATIFIGMDCFDLTHCRVFWLKLEVADKHFQSVYLFLCISVYLCVCFCICMCVCLPVLCGIMMSYVAVRWMNLQICVAVFLQP